MIERERLLELLRVRMIEGAGLSGLDARSMAESVLFPYRAILPERERISLVESLVAGASGLGPLEVLLSDPTVDEIMVNGPDSVWIEREGRLERTEARFESVEALRDAIDRVLVHAGRRVDDMTPMADARLADGSRVNVALPPLAVDGPVMTIRRFPEGGMSIVDLVSGGTLDDRVAGLLECAVRDGLNVLVSGATGSGKTTTLGALARSIPCGERVVTIEDAAELRLDHPHVVRLESRPAGPTGAGAVGIRELVRNALRMRPDRIVVGEVRGPEALDMIDAMATGHSGSLSTVHAASPDAALDRLSALALQAGIGIPAESLERRIASAIDLVVQQRRLGSGRRLVDRVAVVGPGGRNRAEDIYRLEEGRRSWRIAGDRSVRSKLRFA